jgi:hypothetical protein
MTNVITLHSPRAAAPIGLERQQAIENALSTALYYVRQPNTSAATLQAATGRANRALSLLKHACAVSSLTVEG